jgi:hypothetical protein
MFGFPQTLIKIQVDVSFSRAGERQKIFFESRTLPFPLQERKSSLITDSKLEGERSSPIIDSQPTNITCLKLEAENH